MTYQSNSNIRAEVIHADVRFVRQPFQQPLLISAGTIDCATEARVSVRVRVGGREAVGHGSIYLSVIWAWPSDSISVDERDRRLRQVCERLAEQVGALTSEDGVNGDHPLVLGMRLHHRICEQRVLTPPIPGQEAPPALALAMAMSPFDAAIHDAVGVALECSAFSLYRQPFRIPCIDSLFRTGLQHALCRMLRFPPRTVFPAWLVVGKRDNLDRDVRPWVVGRGYRCFKLKTTGTDASYDAERTVEIYRTVRGWGINSPRISVDCNEASPNGDTVLSYLQRVKQQDPEAFSVIDYLEQPTGRDIVRDCYDWHEITRLKPVLLDEGLYNLEQLELAARQGWSGFALKTCKGHSFALVCAAWAHEQGLILSLQDLTNPGYSALHAALFAAHVPTVNGVELNSPQFTPEANRPWLDRLGCLFDPREGVHRLPSGTPVGLGSQLMDQG